MIHWSPLHSPHVLGRYTERTFDDQGIPEEQRVYATCTVCDTSWEGRCLSGQVRAHIQRFATVHAHRDPLAT